MYGVQQLNVKVLFLLVYNYVYIHVCMLLRATDALNSDLFSYVSLCCLFKVNSFILIFKGLLQFDNYSFFNCMLYGFLDLFQQYIIHV